MRASELAWFYTHHLLPKSHILKSFAPLLLCYVKLCFGEVLDYDRLIPPALGIWIPYLLWECDHVNALYIILDE